MKRSRSRPFTRLLSFSLLLLFQLLLASAAAAQSVRRAQPPSGNTSTVLFESTEYGGIPTIFPIVVMR
ncbi:MAG TPA: hypothetical protein VF723_16515, partial [Pyrinomonadaceae bacterium]